MDEWEAAIKELKDAAEREDWHYVDKAIPQIINDERYQKWACDQGIKDEDKNIRDLAVSIIEKAEMPEQVFSQIRAELNRLMSEDEHIYVRFRAAFALANHGAGDYKDAVLKELNEARMDKDVGDLAKAYIAKLRRVKN